MAIHPLNLVLQQLLVVIARSLLQPIGKESERIKGGNGHKRENNRKCGKKKGMTATNIETNSPLSARMVRTTPPRHSKLALAAVTFTNPRPRQCHYHNSGLDGSR